MKRAIVIPAVVLLASVAAAAWNRTSAHSAPTCAVNAVPQSVVKLGPTETLAPPQVGAQPSVAADAACATAISTVPSDFTSASIEFGAFSDSAFYVSINDNVGPSEALNRLAWVVELQGGCLPMNQPYGASLASPPCGAIYVAVDAITGQLIEGFSGGSS